MYASEFSNCYLFGFQAQNCFEKEAGINYGGTEIGKCGEYSTQAAIEAACKSNPDCIGYSMYTGGTGASDADGFKPWCLKSTMGDRSERSDHNYYKRSSCKGTKIFLNTFIYP